MVFTKVLRAVFGFICTLPLFAAPVSAQDQQDEQDADAGQTIIVTATMRQGGAQDVKHFRSISLDVLRDGPLPSADGLTQEGLLGEHDLTLPATGTCEQLFCISTHAMPAALPGRIEDSHFLGIGFDSAMNADAYRRQPVSIIAVVDRSGSMSGEPIARVKEGLHAVLDQMREGDRLGIVIYGSTTLVHQQVIDVEGNQRALRNAINTIRIDGSTYMEAGLRLGYATAFEELSQSRGKTRLMLFTDENPNVGDTSAEGFMGQAISGSRKGVGLTTIGVARHFDARLATKISSVRGGNLFFLPEEGSGSQLFSREFENMVSEVAQDVVITIDPAPGLQVTGVYGVPDQIIDEAINGSVTVTIGSTFLSSNGGGIYASLSGETSAPQSAIARISMSYTDAISQERAQDTEDVYLTDKRAPANLAKAQLLVDQYVTLSQTLAAYQDNRDIVAAAEQLAALSQRIEDSGLRGMGGELELVGNLQTSAEKFAGLNTSGKTQPWEVLGEWEVMRHRGVTDLARGDIVEITDNGEFTTLRNSGRDSGDFIYQDFAINERDLYIEGTDLVMRYRVHNDRLTLRNRLDGTEIVMRKVLES